MTSLVRKNHGRGFAYEHRFVEKRLKEGALKAIRHYGSRGICDVEWTDKSGQSHEAQLKFSTVKLPKVSVKERDRIEGYAMEKIKDGIKVWIVCKISRGPERWECINYEV